jgi:hypothetical protein
MKVGYDAVMGLRGKMSAPLLIPVESSTSSRLRFPYQDSKTQFNISKDNARTCYSSAMRYGRSIVEPSPPTFLLFSFSISTKIRGWRQLFFCAITRVPKSSYILFSDYLSQVEMAEYQGLTQLRKVCDFSQLLLYLSVEGSWPPATIDATILSHPLRGCSHSFLKCRFKINLMFKLGHTKT